ncbi:hypothetical protein BDV96DRAFT_327809 [Lophiotrema nucula]|uniref:C2H2-type domain-containing protein n=1 Tax=Lophiotrema nucula TaxID=690887 RepID=A0A6A5YI35_9PLEO|nr:hypothetical protein BDV96DRAFT_327809 [Lophiotrema nucula]
MNRVEDEHPHWAHAHPAWPARDGNGLALSSSIGSWYTSSSSTISDSTSPTPGDGYYTLQQNRRPSYGLGTSPTNTSRGASYESQTLLDPPRPSQYHSQRLRLPNASLQSLPPPYHNRTTTANGADASPYFDSSDVTADIMSEALVSHLYPSNSSSSAPLAENNFGSYHDSPAMQPTTWAPSLSARTRPQPSSNGALVLALAHGYSSEVLKYQSPARSPSSPQKLPLEFSLQIQEDESDRTYPDDKAVGVTEANGILSSNATQDLPCRFCKAVFHGTSARRNCSRHEQLKHAEMLAPGSSGLNKACRQCGKIFQRGDACTKHERTHKELGLAPAIPRKKSNESQTTDVS